MKINILGTKYEYRETTNKVDAGLNDKNGYCDTSEKIISIETDFNENDQNSMKNLGNFKSKVRRHEIIHAMFFESGLQNECDNEMLVNWIAIQFPKLLQTFKEVGAL